MPFTRGSSNNNSTSSRFGFEGSSRNQSSSAFEFGGNTSSKLHSTSTDNLFSSNRSGLDNDQKRQTGSIKRWSNERGFGFIRRANGGPDLFCHIRSVQNGVQVLDEVKFSLIYNNI
jgi:cold shock CspA family protein